MSAHLEEQIAFFSGVDYARRFRWQTEDPFVLRHEHEALMPLVNALRSLYSGAPLRILESGCGEGVNLMHLRQLGLGPNEASLSGIDPTRAAVDEALRHGFDVQLGDGLSLPYADASFDAVFCRDVLHHLENDETRRIFFAEMRRVCRPGGVVVAIEPNPWNPMIFGLAVFIPQERGLLSLSESRVHRNFPGADVIPVVPSAAWRMWFHFRSPFRHPAVAPVVRGMLRMWEKFSRVVFPKAVWSYRVYIWKQPEVSGTVA